MTYTKITKLKIAKKWMSGLLSKRIQFSRAERNVLKKKKPRLPSEWCEEYVVMPKGAPRPGRWRNETCAYAAGVMDATMYRCLLYTSDAADE